MKPILYGHNISPPVRAVLMLIKELNLDVEFKLTDLLKKEQMDPEFVKINPMHTVPILQHGDVVATDSHSILMYLVDKFVPDSPLFPKDLAKRTEVINKLMFNAAFFFRRMHDVTRPLIFEGVKDIQKSEAKIHEAFDILEAFLTKNEYVAGPQMTIADLAILTTTSSVEILFPISETKWPKYTKWYAKMQKLAYYDEENRKGAEDLKNILISCLNK